MRACSAGKLGAMHRGALLLLLLLSACDAPVAPADGGVDAAIDRDAGADAGADAGPVGPRWCSPCQRDVECGEGGVCMFFEGDRGCGLPCESDSDCAGLPSEARCELEIEGLPRVCRPVSGSCVISPPGEACPSGGCAGQFDRCLDLEGLGAVCTTECANGSDCPIGLRRCRDTAGGRVCVPDEQDAPARCAAITGLDACTSDDDCTGGARCFGAGMLRRCLSAPSGGSCPEGTVRWDGPSGDVCVPSLPSPDPWSETVAPDCHCLLTDEGAMLDEALSSIGRDRCTMTFPHRYLDLIIPNLSHDRFRLSWTDRAQSYWPASLAFGRHVAERIDATSTPSEVLREAAAWADLPLEAGSSTASSDLTEAIARVVEDGGEVADRAAIEAAVSGLSPELAGRMTPIVDAVREAVLAREEAVAILHPDDRHAYFDGPAQLALDGGFGMDVGALEVQAILLGDVDVGRMASASARVLEAIEEADLASLTASGSFAIDTPAGRIGVGGTENDTYEDAQWGRTLLLIELGGDDVYRMPAGATSSAAHGVSVVIDVAGHDEYGYVEVPDPADVGPPGHRRLPSDGAGRATPGMYNGPSSRSMISRQGAGRLGIGLLLDLGVEGDSYRSLRMSQGWGSLGVGVLYDRAGDDVYEGESGVQGASSFGVGLLIDDAGNDQHVAYHAAQGFAYVRAVGVLVDRAGDDEYLGQVDDVLYVSPQDASANSSFVQGVGFGRRDDARGVYMSGGLGVLRDRAGVDRYTAGVFAQATGYWYGAGMLLEGGGDDHYDARWYVQSGDAHFAVSVLLEDGGNDDYNQLARRMNVAIGGGHDFSIAWFVDASGDDVYRAPGISYGAGNDGGAGIFADLAGTDTYDATGNNSFGHGNAAPDDELRAATGTIGIFLEADGSDTYVRPTLGEVANDATWLQTQHDPPGGEAGVGIDRTGGRTGLE